MELFVHSLTTVVQLCQFQDYDMGAFLYLIVIMDIFVIIEGAIHGKLALVWQRLGVAKHQVITWANHGKALCRYIRH